MGYPAYFNNGRSGHPHLFILNWTNTISTNGVITIMANERKKHRKEKKKPKKQKP